MSDLSDGARRQQAYEALSPTAAPIPFGGMKASGLGREGGAEGFEPFVETKYFCLGNLGLPLTSAA